MPKPSKVEIIDVTAANVGELGFFCCMSKRKSPGYAAKLAWLDKRFKEGMQLKLLGGGERGFIEYIPGKYAWRAVDAAGYMFIHCLWVVGKSKGKGFSDALLAKCERDAKKAKAKGVAVVASKLNFLVGPKVFQSRGYVAVDSALGFDLLVKKFARAKSPSFAGGYEKKASKYRKGFTVVASRQCPYIDDSIEIVRAMAAERGEKFRLVGLETAADVREKSPSPYGTYALVYDGRLLTHIPVWKRELEKRLGQFD